jgi:hypothetical protein
VSIVRTKVREWAALGVVVATMLASAVAFAETPTLCHEPCGMTGLTLQQIGFEEFRELYSDRSCGPVGVKEGDHQM